LPEGQYSSVEKRASEIPLTIGQPLVAETYKAAGGFLVPYRLNSAQFAQDILLITCIYMNFSFLCDGILNSSSEKFLASALLA
jgi:hypothetical protein